jgi:hypothetical protein
MKLSDSLVRHFFRFQQEIKLYHWRTQSYSRHRATDKLLDSLLDLVDRFIEAYMGIYGRVSIGKEPMTIRTFTDKNAPSLLKELVDYLGTLDKPLHHEPSLLNIRDEMVSALQQTLFLFDLV